MKVRWSHVFGVFLLSVSWWSLDISTLQAQNSNGLKCGDIVETEYSLQTQTSTGWYYQSQYIDLKAGDSLDISGEAFGDYFTFSIEINDPSNGFVSASDRGTKNPTVQTEVLSQSGTYEVRIRSEDVGSYTLYIGCTLRDGTVIKPGDNVLETPPSNEPTTTIFTGYGFPGIPPVNFSNAIQIPIAKGQAQNGALGSGSQDVFTYTYSANSSTMLSIRRISGNLSIGIAVINQADNNIVFLAGMPSSGNLSVQLDFPTAGTYIIGIFRLDITPNQVGTSGAFEIRLD